METPLRILARGLGAPGHNWSAPPAALTAATTMHTGARDLRGLMVSADLKPRLEESDEGDLGLDGLERATADTWRHWTHMPRARLSEAVALLCGLEPTSLPPQGVWKLARRPSAGAEFWSRVEIAHQHIIAKRLPCLNFSKFSGDSVIDTAVFATWAAGLGYVLPPGFPGYPSAPVPPAAGTKWPWGNHETELLRKLAGAAAFWRTIEEGGNYDPADPNTAPTNEQIEAWLERQGVAEKTRTVMATILRLDGLPPGPRRRKSAS